MQCVNLKERFGERYRVEYEESYYAEYGANPRTDDPWLMIIPCRNGHICPWGDDLLAACTNTANKVAAKLKRLPFTTVAQDGDDGANILFPAKHFNAVAKIMRPRRRRRMSAGQREKFVEAGRKFRFGHGAEGARGAPECDLDRQAPPWPSRGPSGKRGSRTVNKPRP